MAQDTNSFVDVSKRPYWDDYDTSKNFHKILYVPSRAVQARELNQQQSIFQEQIKRFANHVFKNGAMVIPGQVSFNDNIRYVRLDISSLSSSDGVPGLKKLFNGLLNSDNSLKQNVYIRGEESEIEGEVIDIFPHLEGLSNAEIDQLLVKYQSNYNTADQPIIFFRLSKGGKAEKNIGTDKETGEVLYESYDNFINNEVIRFRNSDGTIGTKASDVGSYKGSGLSCISTINEGVYYMNGYFIQVDKQTIVLDRYSNTPTCRVGLKYYESIVQHIDDPSLNDNAQGSYNYAAPGADRLKISLLLEKITLKSNEDFSDNNYDEETFIDLQHIEKGEVTYEIYRSEYAELEKTFARRTYDESGDYTVVPFSLEIKEHLKSKEKNYKNGKWYASDKRHPGDRNKLALCIGPGKAYIKGYERQKIGNTWLELPKARANDEGLQHDAYAIDESHKLNLTYFKLDKTWYDEQTEGASLWQRTIEWLQNEAIGKSFNICLNWFDNSITPSADCQNWYSGEVSNLTTAGTNISKFHVFRVYVDGENVFVYGVIEMFDVKKFFSSINITSNIDNRLMLRENLYYVDMRHNADSEHFGKIQPFYAKTKIGNNFNPNSHFFVVEKELYNYTTAPIVVLDKANCNTLNMVYYGENHTNPVQSIPIEITGVKNSDHFNTIQYSSENINIDISSVYDNDINVVSSVALRYKTWETENSVSDWNQKILTLDTHYSYNRNSNIVSVDIENVRNSYNLETALTAEVGKVYTTNTLDDDSNPYFIIEYRCSKTITDCAKKFIKFRLEPISYGILPPNTGKKHRLSRKDGLNFIKIIKAPIQWILDNNLSITRERLVLNPETGNIEPEVDTVIVNNASIDYEGNAISVKMTNTEQITDVSSYFTFSGGQYDNYYDYCIVQMKEGKTLDYDTTNERIYILYRYFDREQSPLVNVNDSGFFTVDSYVNHVGGIKYEDIPTFTTSYGVKIPLQNAIDFRPDIGSINTETSLIATFNANDTFANYPTEASQSGETFSLNGKDYWKNEPKNSKGVRTLDVFPVAKNDKSVTTNYQYLLPRIDKLYIDWQGKFGIKYGIPSENPVAPEAPANSMALYDIYLDGYTYSVNGVSKKYIENKRYTMRDIGKLEKRVDNLEKYCEMSLLELQTISTQIQYIGQYYTYSLGANDSGFSDLSGSERFKNGFIVETFASHSGQYSHPSYKCSIDVENQILKPSFFTDFIELKLQVPSSNKKVDENGLVSDDKGYGSPLITLPYTSRTFIEQTKASTSLNVNPFQVAVYNGSISFSPDSDNWFDSQNVGTKTVNYNGYYDSINYIAENIVDGTHWGDWYQTGSKTSVKTEPSIVIAEHSETVLDNSTSTKTKRKYRTGTGEGTGEAVFIDERHERNNLSAYANEETTVQTDTYATTTTTTRATTTNTMTVTDWKREGTIVNHKNVINQDDIGDRVVGISNVQYMRSIPILVKAEMMCPNTKVYPFFDENDVRAYCQQCPTVAIGSLSGEFKTTTGVEEDITIDGVVVGKVVFVSDDLMTVVNVSDDNQSKFTNGKKIIGAISKASAICRGSLTTKAKGNISISSDGTCALIFTVPNNNKLKFKCGDKLFVLNDKANNTQSSITRAEGIFSAKGYMLQKENTVLKTKTVQFSSIPTSENNRITTRDSNTSIDIEQNVQYSQETTTTTRTSYYDPLAQSFLIEERGGCFITSITVAFAKKDNKIPIRLEIHEMNNGFPTQSIVPYSVCTKRAKDVKVISPEQIRKSGKIPTAYETTFVMEAPVYLQQNVEYCFVLLSDSFNYEVYCAELGGMNYGNNLRIAEQAYNGVLFKSQNASTWTEDQNVDMYFRINKAVFKNEPSTLRFVHNTEKMQLSYFADPIDTFAGRDFFKMNEPQHGYLAGQEVDIQYEGTNAINGVPASYFKKGIVMASGLNTDSFCVKYPSNPPSIMNGKGGANKVYIAKRVPFNLFRLNTSSMTLNSTSIDWTYDYMRQTNQKMVSGKRLEVLEDNVLPSTGIVVYGSPNSFRINATLKSNQVNLSPAIDINRLGVILVGNKLDKDDFTIIKINNSNKANIIYNESSQTLTINNYLQLYNTANTENNTGIKEFINVAGSHIGLRFNLRGAGYATNKNVDVFAPIKTMDNSKITVVLDGEESIDIISSIASLKGYVSASNVSQSDVLDCLTRILFSNSYVNYISETTNVNNSSASRYISDRVSTENGSHACKIMFSAVQFKHSKFDIYVKMADDSDKTISFDTEPWVKIDRPVEWDTDNYFSNSMTDFKNFETIIEYDYDYLKKYSKSENKENAATSTFFNNNSRPKFTSVAIKIVMLQTDTDKLAQTCQFKNLRIICVL